MERWEGETEYILVYTVKIRFVVSKSAKIKANITECVLKHLLTEIFYFKWDLLRVYAGGAYIIHISSCAF